MKQETIYQQYDLLDEVDRDEGLLYDKNVEYSYS